MSDISTKLTYLNETKQKLKDSLNKFGSNILTTDTFRSYDTKLNDIYNKLPKITQSGAGFTLENVQNGLLDDFKMNGTDLEQDTTTGKQLLNIPDGTYSSNGVTAVAKDGVVTLNGTAGGGNSFIKIPFIFNFEDTKTYTLSANNEDVIGGSSYDVSYSAIRFELSDADGGTSSVSTWCYFGTQNNSRTININYNAARFCIRTGAGLTYNNFVIKPQLEEGSSSTNFEPYTGGIPSPNPDYPQEIKVVEGRQVITDKGKNLFDKDNITKLNGTININSNDFEGGGLNYAVCISCKPNTTYTVTKRNDGNTNRFALASSETIPSSTISELTPVLNKIRDNDSSTLTLTTEISANYLIVQYYRSAENILTEQQILDSIQIEEGSSSTNFEPYYEPVSYNIDLHGKNEFDGEYEDGYYNMNGTKSSTQDPYGRRSTNLNKIEPNTNYSISINNNIISETIRLFYYDANRGFISTESISNGTFTTPAECYYVSWHSSSLKQNYPDGIPNMMIEQGQTVTTYEDYYDYKLAKIPNTNYKNRIYKNNGNWYFERNVEKIDSYNGETINTEYMSTTGQLSIGATIYYVLVNPVTTQITNTTLINQLEAISVYTGTNIITISNSNNIIPEIEITRLKELEKLA